MRNDYSERSERLVSYWWLSLIAGVVLIAIGFFVIANPAASYLSFAVWFGVAVMFSGILTLVQSLSSFNRYIRRGWLILASIADIIIGIILVFNAVFSAFIMPILLLHEGSDILKLMESKFMRNIYFIGEVLDLDALTGGFNLQIAWSTAYAAGNNIK